MHNVDVCYISQHIHIILHFSDTHLTHLEGYVSTVDARLCGVLLCNTQ